MTTATCLSFLSGSSSSSSSSFPFPCMLRRPPRRAGQSWRHSSFDRRRPPLRISLHYGSDKNVGERRKKLVASPQMAHVACGRRRGARGACRGTGDAGIVSPGRGGQWWRLLRGGGGSGSSFFSPAPSSFSSFGCERVFVCVCVFLCASVEEWNGMRGPGERRG